MTITDDLIERFDVDEQAGSSAAGTLGLFDLELARSSMLDASPLEAASGWWSALAVDGEWSVYNGGGVGVIPEGDRPSLGSIGDGVSLWARVWPMAGMLQDDGQWPGDPAGGGEGGMNHQLLGMAGVLANSPVDRYGFGLEITGERGGDVVLQLVVPRQENGYEFVDYYSIGDPAVPADGATLRGFSVCVTVTRTSRTGSPAQTPVASTMVTDEGSAMLLPRRRAAQLATSAGTVTPDWRLQREVYSTVAGSSSVLSGREGGLQAAQLDAGGPVNDAQATAGGGVVTIPDPADRSPYCTVRVYVNGEQVGDDFDWLPTEEVRLDRVAFGCVAPSVGGFGRAAVWGRAITADEVAGLGGTGDSMFGSAADEAAGLGTINPLLDSDGSSGIYPDFMLPLTEPVAVLETDGAHRHTRRPHERVPRMYELGWRLSGGDDFDRVREALEVSAYGSIPVRWRSPDDAAGRVDESPRWLIRNAGEGEFEAVRARDGSSVAMSLILEETFE